MFFLSKNIAVPQSPNTTLSILFSVLGKRLQPSLVERSAGKSAWRVQVAGSAQLQQPVRFFHPYHLLPAIRSSVWRHQGLWGGCSSHVWPAEDERGPSPEGPHWEDCGSPVLSGTYLDGTAMARQETRKPGLYGLQEWNQFVAAANGWQRANNSSEGKNLYTF